MALVTVRMASFEEATVDCTFDNVPNGTVASITVINPSTTRSLTIRALSSAGVERGSRAFGPGTNVTWDVSLANLRRYTNDRGQVLPFRCQMNWG